jgi:hypothetical protein
MSSFTLGPEVSYEVELYTFHLQLRGSREKEQSFEELRSLPEKEAGYCTEPRCTLSPVFGYRAIQLIISVPVCTNAIDRRANEIRHRVVQSRL